MHNHGMPLTATRLTVEEFHNRYAKVKGAEFWFGEVRYKSAPTWLHGSLQALLAELLTRAGYASGSEVELRIDPDWEPKPDVAASLVVEEPYPTEPIDIAVEIFSAGDSVAETEEKCRHYARIGIRQIFVFDPEQQKIEEWVGDGLVAVTDVVLADGVTVTARTIWSELDRRRTRVETPASRVI